MPHERLQEFVIIDYTREMSILAVREQGEREEVVGLGQCFIDESTHTADVAVVVRDDYQNRGVGTELLAYLTHLGNRPGLLWWTAQVLMGDRSMLHLLDRMGFDIVEKRYGGVCKLKLTFVGGEVS
jgi:GNAT superfamily N-acetyltransferase